TGMRLGLELDLAEVCRQVVTVDRRHKHHPIRTQQNSGPRSLYDLKRNSVGFRPQTPRPPCRRTPGSTVLRTQRRSCSPLSVADTVWGRLTQSYPSAAERKGKAALVGDWANCPFA